MDDHFNYENLEIPYDIDFGDYEFDNLSEELAELEEPNPALLEETRASLAEARKYANKTCNLIKSGLEDGSVKSTASLLACQAEILIATEALEKATSNLLPS
ncbi:unnamed protein product [Microthlaspi erraticum]|uniref:Uncharacterized protein n=1 Tax=Microthlaspi erraticum TaxID=1685480 RepID=A0A6D2J7B7_9BRAS|nr:unnamed protein product [Microthlaspi erraticum]